MAVWNELFKQEQFRWKDPDRNVVEFARLLKERDARSVLDLGCGAGRHLIYLTGQGFKTYGVDISENGLELAHRWLEQERFAVGAHDVGAHGVGAHGVGAHDVGAHDVGAHGVGAHGVGAQYTEPLLSQCDMTRIPFRDASFDALIGVHVIQHQTLRGIGTTTAEIRRVLRSGGLTYLTFPGRRDSRWGKGEEVEPNTFISSVGPDSGVPHHYSSLAEVEELLDGLVIRRVELVEHTYDPGDMFSHWEVLAEKP